MNLKSFLAADRIIIGLTADSPREALEKLVAPLIKNDIVTDEAQFLDDLVAREAQITTVMDNSVALPHARSHAVRRLGLSVGLAPDGIRFNPESDTLSRLFFCIAVPSFAPTAHIGMLQTLAKFARDPKRVEKLLASKQPGIANRYLGSFKG
jgi:mannitol/fructose-specific phosphotransferase system IIA component (Ntr-type)